MESTQVLALLSPLFVVGFIALGRFKSLLGLWTHRFTGWYLLWTLILSKMEFFQNLVHGRKRKHVQRSSSMVLQSDAMLLQGLRQRQPPEQNTTQK